jgi:hypothetical protein
MPLPKANAVESSPNAPKVKGPGKLKWTDKQFILAQSRWRPALGPVRPSLPLLSWSECLAETGLDPLDPKDEKATIDYALQRASTDACVCVQALLSPFPLPRVPPLLIQAARLKRGCHRWLEAP